MLRIFNYIASLVLVLSFTPDGKLAWANEPVNTVPITLQGLDRGAHLLGTRQYLVYMEDIETGVFQHQSVWTRTSQIVEKQGEMLIETRQKWVSSTPNWNKELYSLNRVSDFSPVFHQTWHGPDRRISAYSFSPEVVLGDASVDGNSKQGFSMPASDRTLNFELDMEAFALLPYRVGDTYLVNFYHPGSPSEPQDYAYTVTKEDTLKDSQGALHDCWVLHVTYEGHGYADFWIDKSSRLVLKMEEEYDTSRRYKILLGYPMTDS